MGRNTVCFQRHLPMCQSSDQYLANAGFPSSHSTNAVSIALFLASLLVRLQETQTISQAAVYVGWIGKPSSERHLLVRRL